LGNTYKVDMESEIAFEQQFYVRQSQIPYDYVFPCTDELIQQQHTLTEELSKMRDEVKRKGNKKLKKVMTRKKVVLPPSDGDSDSGYEDYHVEFRDALGHRENYYQESEENGSGSVLGSGIVQGRREGESEGDDSYRSEVLKSPISVDCDSDGTRKVIFPQFNEGSSVGEVILTVGMKFAT
jgi:hypothetical protein